MQHNERTNNTKIETTPKGNFPLEVTKPFVSHKQAYGFWGLLKASERGIKWKGFPFFIQLELKFKDV